ncbi:trans-sialidase, putative [Trypanosoma cruzi marinkellei]|uniref:Trans-sialidase, putative n=1 Tax=Trypanosoma cruzi marinkellei TaxID=85056 RepID=K2N3Q0_TRYCR|nr:trans-sialidase, putative [Trypanosoma cruzi marinkellei]
MSWHHFYSAVLLLLVVMMCWVSGAATADERKDACPGPSEKYFVWRDVKDGETVDSLHVPSLVEVDGDVFAVAEAQCTKKKDDNKESFTGIASELLELSDENLKKELDTNKLKTQVLEECSTLGGETCALQSVISFESQSQKKLILGRPTTVVKGNDMYMLAGIYLRENVATCQESARDAASFELLLVKGNVSNGGSNNRIFLNDTYVIPWTSNDEQHKSLKSLNGGGGSGVKMEDGTLVFPVEATKKEEEKTAEGIGEAVSLILYFSEDNKSWKLSKEISDDGCSDPSLVKWEKGKLIMMTACDGGRRRVYESGDKGDSWTEALGTLSRVWGNPTERKGPRKGVGSGFITATVGDVSKKVMLVTLPVYSKLQNGKEGNGKGRLHLWLTDNTHIVDIGPVSGNDEDVTASSLLYKSGKDNRDELIALYEKEDGHEEDEEDSDEEGEEASLGMVSVRLTAQLQRVKEVLATWKKVDERVSKLCTTLLAAKVTLPANACSADKVTSGLVGFLSGNFSGNTWSDEYLGVNATVKENGGAKKADNGVKFQGAGAEWPVGRQGENQLYHFANYNFTLVATVSIDGVPKSGSVPLIGAKMNVSEGENKLMELSYDNEKNWQFSCGGQTTEKFSSTLGAEKTQHVVTLVRNGNQGSAYVDGKRVGGDAPCALGNNALQEISNFYIGGDGSSTVAREGVPVTVTNVLLYNRPLDGNEITALNTKNVIIPKLEGPPPPAVGDPPEQKAGTPSAPAGPQLTEQEHSSGSAGENEDSAGGTNGQEEEVQRRVMEVNATALSSSLGNESQGNNSDAGTMRGSGLLPSLLLLLLGLWGFAAL